MIHVQWIPLHDLHLLSNSAVRVFEAHITSAKCSLSASSWMIWFPHSLAVSEKVGSPFTPQKRWAEHVWMPFGSSTHFVSTGTCDYLLFFFVICSRVFIKQVHDNRDVRVYERAYFSFDCFSFSKTLNKLNNFVPCRVLGHTYMWKTGESAQKHIVSRWKWKTTTGRREESRTLRIVTMLISFM